jgi:hypothetical protein
MQQGGRRDPIARKLRDESRRATQKCVRHHEVPQLLKMNLNSADQSGQHIVEPCGKEGPKKSYNAIEEGEDYDRANTYHSPQGRMRSGSGSESARHGH